MREYYYETVYIMRPTLSEEEVEKVMEKVSGAVEKFNGEIIHTEKWGKKQLAYPINDYPMGYYVLLHIKTNERDFVKNLENFFRINEDIIRFLSFRIKPSEVKGLKKEESKPNSEEANG
ncbi:30S ribosomal protein S6 [Desulfurobacterium atlanticum]|uniref:Small ribosomal subunit protein bS6 n=1 Tax=Desulfurobacterium atlanticum TaxID=240169 RepID=A0A238ZH18_9BACT|nr:30S ribosomal protein S6 [Desulfurobacterium atlanticum]SNR82452.1 small subunit ribosomal protein S6 [Desulfurobacterium atlanticum]